MSTSVIIVFNTCSLLTWASSLFQLLWEFCFVFFFLKHEWVLNVFFSIDWYDHGNCFPLWSVYIMDHIDWIWILSQLYLHNTKPMCLWCIIPFIYCWILFDNILLRNVASIFMRDTGLYFFLNFCSVCHGEGNGTPLQYFFLENPMDRGAW